MSSDPSGAAPITPLPDPFALLSRFDNFRAAVEPLAAEFWAAREPLKNALVALEHGWDHDPAGYTLRCLAVGAELQQAGLSAFPAEMANALRLDAAPQPEQIATQATWCVLAAATANDGAGVAALLKNLFARPALSAEFSAVLMVVVDTCLAKWRCEASPRFTARAREELTRLNLAPSEAMEWMRNGNTELSPSARRALRDWLYAIELGQPIAMSDPADSWGPEVPGMPCRKWFQCSPVAQEHQERMFAQIVRGAEAAYALSRSILAPPIPPISAPPGPDDTTDVTPRADEPAKLRIPKADAERLVHDYLLAHAGTDPFAVTLRQVASGTGVSNGAVCKTIAWITFETRRKSMRESSAALRTVPLTNEMLAAIPTGDDDRDAALAEIIRKAELAKLIEEQQEDDEADDRRPNRRKRT